MSIASELGRLQQAKADLETSIEAKGVSVPAGTKLDAYPALVDTISGSSVLTGDAAIGEVLASKTFYSNDPDSKLTGTMVNRGEVDTDITTVAQSVSIAAGYHNGSGTTQIQAAEQAKLIAANIASGVTVLGVAGSHAGAPVMDGNAGVGDVLATKTFYNTDPNTKETGTMTNRGAVSTDITAVAQAVTIAAGYHNGSGTTQIAAADQAKIITGNIKSGVTVLGVAGAANVVDTTSGDAIAADLLAAKKAWVDGAEVTGAMVDRGTVSTDISAVATEVTIAAGKHSGSGVVKIHADEQAKIITGNIKSGITILGVSGAANVVDTTSGDAIAADILATKKAWVDGAEVTGAMTNRGEVNTDISAVATEVTIAAGYHNGSGTVKIAAADQAKIIAGNIKDGVTILGVEGTASGGSLDPLSDPASESDILYEKEAYDEDGAPLTGTIANAIIVTSVDGDGYPLTVDHYGAMPIYAYKLSTGVTYRWARMQGVTFKTPSLTTSLGSYAFGYCTGLTMTTLPSHITSLGTYTFRNCTSLTQFTLPSGMTSLPSYAFAGCTGLQTFVGEKLAGDLAYANGALSDCTALASAQLGSIGSAVTAMTSTFFNNCTQLGLTITIYVTPSTQPLASSPWGATNATIVYKSAVDGSTL